MQLQQQVLNFSREQTIIGIVTDDTERLKIDSTLLHFEVHLFAVHLQTCLDVEKYALIIRKTVKGHLAVLHVALFMLRLHRPAKAKS
jgi:hypothetical protein